MARVGIIGTGWGSRVQVPLFRKAGLEVVSIAGSDPAKTAQIAKDNGLRGARDWREIVDDSSIDVVSIVAPPHLHRDMALAALEAGKHVVCEKPTAMNAREAEEMMRAAESKPGQIAIIDHELRFLPSFRAARSAVDGIGPVRLIEMRFSSPSRGDASRAWNWWSDAAQGGGVWGAVGSHFVDAIRYLVGEIEEAQSIENTFIRERPGAGGMRAVTSDDFFAVHLRLTEGSVAVLSFSVVSAVDENSTIVIHGDKGGVRLESDHWWSATRKGEWTLQRVDAGDLPAEPRTLPGNSPGGYFGSGTWYLARAIREALDDGLRDALAPAATFVDGWLNQRVLDAARESAGSDGAWRRA